MTVRHSTLGYGGSADEYSGPAAATPMLRVPQTLLADTFARFRLCGKGNAECQMLWLGPWSDSTLVTEVVHPKHSRHRGGFVLDDAWLTGFWLKLAERSYGIRAQVHTHPAAAFHSATDDAWPVVHLAGFLSLVVPDFAQGPVTLDRTYLAEIGPDGAFREVDPHSRLALF